MWILINTVRNKKSILDIAYDGGFVRMLLSVWASS